MYIIKTKIKEHLKTLIGINYIDKQESTNNTKSSVLVIAPAGISPRRRNPEEALLDYSNSPVY